MVVSFAHCRRCENCLTGHPTVCLRFSFGTHVVAHERNVVKVDKDVDLALLGPLGCGTEYLYAALYGTQEQVDVNW